MVWDDAIWVKSCNMLLCRIGTHDAAALQGFISQNIMPPEQLCVRLALQKIQHVGFVMQTKAAMETDMLRWAAMWKPAQVSAT